MGRTYGYRISGWFRDKLELSRSGNARNIRPMEGLRGFAALLVFGYHYLYFIEPYLENAPVFGSVVGKLSQVGNAGVDLFFVLSGYLIYGSLIARPQPLGRYLWRRVVRIYPAFLVMFSLYVALSYAVPGSNRIPASPPDAVAYLLSNLLLLGPLLVPVWPLIPVAWSLSYEMFYYLLTPLLISSFGLRGRTPAWRTTFFVLLAGLYLGLCALYPGHSRLAMFVAGIVLYETLTHARVRPPAALPTALVCLAGLGAYASLYERFTDVPLGTLILMGSFFTLCFHLFAVRGGWLRSFFEWTPLRWFGNMSYSFYLTHVLSMRVFALALPDAAFSPAAAPFVYLGLLPLFFLASLPPALTLYLAVERPFSLTGRPRSHLGGRRAPAPLETP